MEQTKKTRKQIKKTAGRIEGTAAKKYITIKVEYETWNKIRQFGKKEGRKLNWIVEQAFKQYFNETITK